MEVPWSVILLFFLGMVVQALRVVGNFRDLKIFFLVLLLSLIAYIPGKREHDYSLIYHTYFFLFLVPVFFFSFFYKNLLRKVNEFFVAFYNIIFIYLVFVVFQGFLSDRILLIISFPSLICLFLTVRHIRLSGIFQALIYGWYMILTLTVMVIQISLGDIAMHLKGVLKVSNPVITIFSGMIYIDLITRFLSVVMMLPIPSRHQSFKSRLKQVREYMRLLAGRYADWQMNLFSLAVLVIISSLLIINYRFYFFSDFALINTLLVITPIIHELPIRKINWIAKAFIKVR